MKKLPVILLLVVITALFSLCKKGDTGPAGANGTAGAQGVPGPQGPTGVAGNANVTQYTFGAADFAAISTPTLLVTTTADTMNNSAWFVYLVTSSALVYPVPGYGSNGTSQYRTYWFFSSNKVNFIVSRFSGTGEAYTNIKIIRIYVNNNLTGGRVSDGLPDIDFKDYHAVCRHYNLKE